MGQSVTIILLMTALISMFEAARDVNLGGRASRYSSRCNWPTPYDLAKIEPNLLVRTQSDSIMFNISSNDQLDNMVSALLQANMIRDRVLFVVHGYEGSIDDPWLKQISNAILAVDDDTVIVVGWGKGADIPFDYVKAASNTQTVSAVVSLLSQKLKDARSPYLYCIGHSLGAHICGQAGSTFKLDRISGLDPAGPGFQDCPSNPGLNSSSANCVDVLHTNGAATGFGRLDPLGHIDFYPSCGQMQPGCRMVDVACSHDKARDYFIDTVNAALTPQSYPAAQGPCDSDFPDQCIPCTNDSCPSAQPSCPTTNVTVYQPVGYRSVCSDVSVSSCGQLTRQENYGLWFVAVTKSGFDLFCPNEQS